MYCTGSKLTSVKFLGLTKKQDKMTYVVCWKAENKGLNSHSTLGWKAENKGLNSHSTLGCREIILGAVEVQKQRALLQANSMKKVPGASKKNPF
jgi:hypothetical protein